MSPSRYLNADLVSRARRFWWAAVGLAVLVALLSGIEFAATPRHYSTTQTVRVVVLPVSGSAQMDTSSLTDAAARSISSPTTLGAPAFATAVLSHISANEQARDHLSPTAIATALAATHQGASVALTATRATPKAAQDLLAAALDALQDPSFDASLAAQAGTADDSTVRIQADAAASPVDRTPGEEGAALILLFERIVFGLIAAALVLLAVTVIVPSLSEAPVSATGA